VVGEDIEAQVVEKFVGEFLVEVDSGDDRGQRDRQGERQAAGGIGKGHCDWNRGRARDKGCSCSTGTTITTPSIYTLQVIICARLRI